MELGFSIGSNLGDRLQNLRNARDRLVEISGAKLIDCSSVYETAPVDVRSDDADKSFLNAFIILESDLPVGSWLKIIGQVEQELGRVRTYQNAPRTVDVDLIFADDFTSDDPALLIPHPRWFERRFVAEPFAEIRPDLILPNQSKSVAQILGDLMDDGVAIFLDRSAF